MMTNDILFVYNGFCVKNDVRTVGVVDLARLSLYI